MKLYDEINNRTTFLSSSIRGRILDRNGKVLVDNKGVNTLVFNKMNKYGNEDEITISKKLSKILNIDTSLVKEIYLKDYYLITHDNGNNLIKKSEYTKLKKRLITNDDIIKLKYKRITTDMLNSIDKGSAYIYYLLNNGYYYQDKIIKKDLTDEELAKVNNLSFNSLRIITTFKRVYPYGDTLRDVFGTVNETVPYELKDEYLKEGVPLNSSAGISGLERTYDKYLRGKDSIYKVENDKLKLIQKEKKGNDLYLSIDIDIVQKINAILKEEMIKAKKFRSSKYYNHSYVLVGDPKTGEIISINGYKYNNGSFTDITGLITESSYTVGSVVKGATISVGYKEKLIKPGALVLDSCIKVYGVSKKCSWKRLGRVDDVKALAYSSNYYQFLIATKLTNPGYRWNSKLNAKKEDFDTYRNMLASYGLGAKTNIDLPNEKTGIKNSTVSDDLLLNLAIGQLDTYTPAQMLQYINTIADNGKRYKLNLMKYIKDPNDKVIKINKTKLLDRVDIDKTDMERIQKGFTGVIKYGTARGYTRSGFNGAGKTGTSETFIDTNDDGKVDTKTISTAFLMYAPVNDPKYSIVIISPNIGITNGNTSSKYSINLYLNKKITNTIF